MAEIPGQGGGFGVTSWTSATSNDSELQVGNVVMHLEDLGDDLGEGESKFYWTEDGILGKWSSAGAFKAALGIVSIGDHGVQAIGNAQTIPDGEATVLSFNSVTYDTDTFWDNGDPTLITIPENGKYLFTLEIFANPNYTESPAGPKQINAQLSFDGGPLPLGRASAWNPIQTSGDIGGNSSAMLSVIRALGEGSVVTALVSHNIGEPWDFAVILSVQKIGDYSPA